MGKLSKLLAKAEELANKELEKLQQQQQQQGGHQQQGQQQHQQAYAPPVVLTGQQYAGFSTPPPSPPPYAGSVWSGRPSTPQAQPTQSILQQQSPSTPQVQSPVGPTPQLTPSPSSASRGRKKALLIACSYPGSRAQLRGPSNDVQCMQVRQAAHPGCGWSRLFCSCPVAHIQPVCAIHTLGVRERGTHSLKRHWLPAFVVLTACIALFSHHAPVGLGKACL